MPKRLSRTT